MSNLNKHLIFKELLEIFTFILTVLIMHSGGCAGEPSKKQQKFKCTFKGHDYTKLNILKSAFKVCEFDWSGCQLLFNFKYQMFVLKDFFCHIT